MTTTFKTRLNNALKSYRNSGKMMLDLTIEATVYAQEHDHSPTFLNTIINAMQGKGDVTAMQVVIQAFGPFKVAVQDDGTFKVNVTKGDKAYPICEKGGFVHDLAYTATSFRTLADELSVKPVVIDDLSVAELLIALNKKIDTTATKGDRPVKCSAMLADALAETLRIAEAELEAKLEVKDTAVVLQIADLRAA